MERYVGRRVQPVPHRRIDEAIAHLPAPAWPEASHGDIAEVAHAVAVVVICLGLAVTGGTLANVLEAALLAHLH